MAGGASPLICSAVCVKKVGVGFLCFDGNWSTVEERNFGLLKLTTLDKGA